MSSPIAGHRWAIAMVETVCLMGCSCVFCIRRLGTGDTEALDTQTPSRSRSRRRARRSLPSTSSVMEVLYPSSYLGTSPVFPDPPSYLSGDTYPSTAQGERRECIGRVPPISSTTLEGRAVALSGQHNPLVEAPSLTGVPSPGAPSGRIQPVEPNAPIVGLGIDVLEEAEPLPAYSRFDDNRSRLPVASGVLGPYPPISYLRDEGE